MFFAGEVASVVAEVGSLFPGFQASICKSCGRTVHRTVARPRFADLHSKMLKTVMFGALLEDRQNVHGNLVSDKNI